MAIDKSKLVNYVNANKDIILKNTLFGAPSIELFSKMTNVKGDANLNLLDTTVSFGDGKTCGWADNAESKLSTRKLETAIIKVDAAFCQRALSKYWAGEELNQKIGIETLPQEDKFVSDLVTKISEKMEGMLYYGDKTNSSETQFDGICTIAIAEAANTASTINKVTATSAQTMYTRIGNVIEAIPSKFYNESIVLLSTTSFRKAIKEFETANPYKTLEFVGEDKMEFIYPNTNIHVKGVAGMDTNTATRKEDIISIVPRLTFYGADYEEAAEEYRFEYFSHDDQFEYHSLWNSGTQFAYMDSVVWCATPTANA